MKKINTPFTYKKITIGFWLLLLPAVFFSCLKKKIEPVEVYPEPPAAKVKFLDASPNPSIGAEGSEVTFQVTGLDGKKGDFNFFINQTKAEVLSVTENTVKVKVPANASTGGSSILIDGEYYFGPTFIVKGKVSIDPDFKPDVYRSNGPITEMKEWNSSEYIATGEFTNYQDKANANVIVPGMVRLLITDLSYVTNNNISDNGQFLVGKDGITSFVNSIVPVPGGKYLVSGLISQYDSVRNVAGITRINADGTIDSTVVDIIGTAPNDKATVPAFNGGVLGIVTKTFYDQNTGKVTVIGNFTGYRSTFYERSSKDGLFYDYVPTSQIVRMEEDGQFDSTFNYNYAENKGYAGANGTIYDAIQLSNGDFLLSGNFTSFNGVTANRVVRLSGVDGSVVSSFLGGADGPVNKIVQNEQTGTILLTGNFRNYNGQPANQVVMIDENGAVLPGFKIAETDGAITFAGQLSSGKIILSGTFTRYDSTVREGMAILNPDGTLAKGYNNFGLFRGRINGFLESKTALGQDAVTIYGSMDKFDNISIGNIVRFRIEN